MMTKMPTTYKGLPLDMKLPLRVEESTDCVHVFDHSGAIICEGMLSATDAHYMVDAINEYAMVREAKSEALANFRKFVREYFRTDAAPVPLGKVEDELMDELTRRIEALR